MEFWRDFRQLSTLICQVALLPAEFEPPKIVSAVLTCGAGRPHVGLCPIFLVLVMQWTTALRIILQLVDIFIRYHTAVFISSPCVDNCRGIVKGSCRQVSWCVICRVIALSIICQCTELSLVCSWDCTRSKPVVIRHVLNFVQCVKGELY